MARYASLKQKKIIFHKTIMQKSSFWIYFFRIIFNKQNIFVILSSQMVAHSARHEYSPKNFSWSLRSFNAAPPAFLRFMAAKLYAKSLYNALKTLSLCYCMNINLCSYFYNII